MNRLIALFAALAMLSGTVLTAQQKTPPQKLSFAAKAGKVTFDHAAHSKRVKGDCKVCHEKLWPQSAKAPLNYKAALHRNAETKRTSCGACHRPGGDAFESKGNCARCHAKASAKKS